MFKKILVLSPHTDDGEIGCGGAISKFIREGAEVRCVAFSYADDKQLINEMEEAMNILGIDNYEILDFKRRYFYAHRQDILDKMIVYRKDYNPDLIFSPSSTDNHQDHAVVFDESLRAFKESSIFGYEMPWNTITFRTTGYISLDRDDVVKKIKATKCYKTQVTRMVFNTDFLMCMMRTRGVPIKQKYAEAFEVLKLCL